MFGKKLLSVVGLIFLGSQIISVEGACSPTYDGSTCNAAGCADDVGKTFIVTNGGNNYVVEIKSSEVGGETTISCDKKTESANYCTAKDAKDGSVINTIVGFCDGTCDAGGLTYSCVGGSCTEDVVPNTCKRASCTYNGSAFSGCKAGDFLVLNPGVALLDNTERSDGTLYKCTGTTNCEQIEVEEFEVGYYKNAGSIDKQYIKCTALDACSPVAVTGGTCSGSNNGELVILNNAVNICLDNGVPLKLEGVTSAQKYFMKMDIETGSKNVFEFAKNSGIFKYSLL